MVDNNFNEKNEIIDYIKFLVGDNNIFELTLINPFREKSEYWYGTANEKSIICGWFDDYEKAVDIALKISGSGKGVYFTVNPCSSEFFPSNRNKLTVSGKRTKDTEILAIRNLYIDIDLLGDHNYPASDLEHERAEDAAREILMALDKLDWPHPAVIDSGNGIGIFYPVNLPNDSTSVQLLKSVLVGLTSKFAKILEKYNVAIDTKVSNPARLTRMPGTLNCKGESTKDRCYRLAKILILPKTRQELSLEKLLAAAGWAQEQKKDTPGLVEKSKKSRQLSDIELIPVGQRNCTLASKAGSMRRKGMSPEMIEDNLLVINENQCDPPLDPKEVARIAKSIGRYPPGNNSQHQVEKPEQNILNNYTVIDGKICYFRQSKSGFEQVWLSNFSCQIVREIVADDGAKNKMYFEIEGKLADGRKLRKVRVSADDFNSLNWVTKAWGCKAIISPGSAKKDHLRAAIQNLSQDADQLIVFEHTGWRKLNDNWVYLCSSGGIGPNGKVVDITTELPDQLACIDLPDPPADPTEAIRSAMTVLNCADYKITMPLFAATLRATLGEILPVAASVFLIGPTGAGKSTLASIFQSFYGSQFGLGNLPANWQSTANSLEKLIFLAKDAMLVIDDYCPRGSAQDIRRLGAKADRVFRGVNNRQARDRMTASGELRARNWPRCLVAATGEDLPTGQSLRARILTLVAERQDINWEQITKAQSLAINGTLAQAMSAFLQWLANKIDSLKKTLPKRREEIRNKLHKGKKWPHQQTPTLLADLYLGLELWLAFALESKAMAQDEINQWKETFLQVLETAGLSQAEHIGDQDPVNQFFDLLSAVISSGQAHIAKLDGTAPENYQHWGWRKINSGPHNNPIPLGNLIGWVSNDGQMLLLEPTATYTCIQQMASYQRLELKINENTLWRRLKDKKCLIPGDGKHLTVKQRFGKNIRKRVLRIPLTIFFEQTWHQGDYDMEYDEMIGSNPYRSHDGFIEGEL